MATKQHFLVAKRKKKVGKSPIVCNRRHKLIYTFNEQAMYCAVSCCFHFGGNVKVSLIDTVPLVKVLYVIEKIPARHKASLLIQRSYVVCNTLPYKDLSFTPGLRSAECAHGKTVRGNC